MRLPQIIMDALALPPEASTISRDVDNLHLIVISLTMVGSLCVTAVAAYFIFKHRRHGAAKSTPHIESPDSREWAVGAGIFALFVTIWWIGFKQYVRINTPPRDAAVVYVTAKQWMWKFTYADGSGANDVLTVPLGKPVKLIMTSRDVIHSFYVPAFRLKQDVLPGRYVTLWFEPTEIGDFDIFCAEYCGLSHSDMHGLVRVVSAENYSQILDDSLADRSGGDDLLARGKHIAEQHQCLACHAVDDQPRTGPPWAHLYGSWQNLTDGRRVLVDDEYLTRSMMEPNTDVVQGYRPVMPSYAGLIDPAETAALVAFIRSLREGPRP
jgi:cytochrome c oxidase subunit 2